jgi:hypothetical protein
VIIIHCLLLSVLHFLSGDFVDGIGDDENCNDDANFSARMDQKCFGLKLIIVEGFSGLYNVGLAWCETLISLACTLFRKSYEKSLIKRNYIVTLLAVNMASFLTSEKFSRLLHCLDGFLEEFNYFNC